MILVSACLAGVKTRHDGTSRTNETVMRLIAEKKAVPLCPETLGGRPIPREPVEIVGGDGYDVLSGKAKVLDKNGNDHTAEILSGVEIFMKALKKFRADTVILKAKSPACGQGIIYDGSFSGKLKSGDGVLAAALEKEGIRVFNENNCDIIMSAVKSGFDKEEHMADLYFLPEYPIYRDFDADDIEILAKICGEKKYTNGQAVFRENEAGDGMYIIKKGVVKIFKENKARKKFIASLTEGEFFGELALIDGSPRSATVEASGDVELVKLSTESFARLKSEYARTGFKVTDVLLKFLSYRIRRTTKKAATLMKGRKIKKLKKTAKKNKK
jgi:uncharacterized protein YbbK (DUF523 family)/CRP-like cAMP-binding protein